MTDQILSGTRVRYHGSIDYLHGEYTVTTERDLNKGDHGYYSQPEIIEHYTDGICYDLWPVGVPHKFGNRDQGIYFVRRESFTVIG